MNSFYGGKQGRTYHIVQRYDCVNIYNFIEAYDKAIIDKIDNEADKETARTVQNVSKFIDSTTTPPSITGDIYKGQVICINDQYYLVTKDFSSSSQLTDSILLIQGMVNCFSKGGSYNKVNYGEYVIIDTIEKLNHKDDLQNGLLFRRGFDYNDKDLTSHLKPDINSEDFKDSEGNFDKVAWQAAWSNWVQAVGGGAIYVGQIVGPEGNAPQLDPISWEDFKNLSGTKHKIRPVSQTVGWDAEQEGQTGQENDHYGDYIQVGTTTIKDSDGNITGAKIAFDIPMPTIFVSGQVVDSYGYNARSHQDIASGQTDENIEINILTDENEKIIGYDNLIHLHSETGKNANHPFYYNYDIAVPQGIHGTDLSQIKVKTGVAEEEGLDSDTQIFIGEDENYITDSQGNNLVADDQYITFSLTDYNFITGDFEDPRLGTKTINHGRLPFRVINEIKQALFKREYLDLNNISNNDNISIGTIYQIKENLYAICIKEGKVTSSLKAWLEDVENRVPGNVSQILNTTEEKVSKWRVIEMNRAAAAGLQIDYKAGESDYIATNFADYLYLDDAGYLHAIYNNYDTTSTDKDKDERIAENNQDVILGFIDSIATITHNDGELTIVFKENNRQEVFDLNTIVDIQRYGNSLYALFSDKKLRQKYAETHTLNEDYRYFKYSGINPDSRFKDSTLQDDTTGFIYVKINATIPSGQYLVHGDYKLKDLIWVAKKSDQIEEENEEPYFDTVLYTGCIADVEEKIWNLNERTNYKPPIVDGEPFIFEQYQQGRIVTITTKINGQSSNSSTVGQATVEEESSNSSNETNLITLYAYNFNKDKIPATYQLSQLPEVVDDITNYINSHQDEFDDEFEFDPDDYIAYSYWYEVQQMNQSTVRPSRIYIIDNETFYENQEYTVPEHNHILNEGGLWLVTTTGHSHQELIDPWADQ